MKASFVFQDAVRSSALKRNVKYVVTATRRIWMFREALFFRGVYFLNFWTQVMPLLIKASAGFHTQLLSKSLSIVRGCHGLQ